MTEPWWIYPDRSEEEEILDNLELEGAAHFRNLRELAMVNRWLGGHKVLWRGIDLFLRKLPQEPGPIKIVDVGCGGGDNLIYLAQKLRKAGHIARLIGIDASASAVSFSREVTREFPEIEILHMNVFSEEFARLDADIYTFNLVLHHFKNQDIKNIFKHCNKGAYLLINDLQRNRIAYVLFGLVTFLIGFSRIGRHDGLLSIKKSFSRSDWNLLLANKSITKHRISWSWAFRYLVLIQRALTNGDY